MVPGRLDRARPAWARRTVTILGCVASLVGLVFVVIPSASAAAVRPAYPTNQVFRIQSKWAAYAYRDIVCLSDPVRGNSVYDDECTSGVYYNEDWYQPPPAGRHIIQNVGTGRCLDDSEYGLRVLACNGADYQLWYSSPPTRDGAKYYVNAHTGRCLDDSDYRARSYGCNDSRFNAPYYQQWYEYLGQ